MQYVLRPGEGIFREAPPSVTSEQTVKSAYSGLTTDKEKADFLKSVVRSFKEHVDRKMQQARTSAPDVDGQYAWARSQTPPIDLDALAAAALPMRNVSAMIESGEFDKLVQKVGTTPSAILPGAGEPSSGGRKRRGRKTRKTRSRRRLTRRTR